jgi:hypothetical protein
LARCGNLTPQSSVQAVQFRPSWSDGFLIDLHRFYPKNHGLRTVDCCNDVTHEIVTKPELKVRKRKRFLSHIRFIIQFTIIAIMIAILSCVLVVLNCISVFAISTALEEVPLSEILLSQGEGSLV